MRANLPASALGAVIIATTATHALAAEFQKPVTQWTCAEFLSVDDEFKPTVIHSAIAYVKGGETATRDINDTEKVIPRIIGECIKAPEAAFWTSLKDEWKKIGAVTGGQGFQ